MFPKIFNWVSLKKVVGILGLTNGGTGSSTASGARTNLDVYSTSEVDALVSVDPYVNNQTGTTYPFALTDIGGTVTASNASASTYTLPQTSSVAFPIGSRIKLINLGAGAVTLVKEGAETLLGNPLVAQYATVEIEKISATSWQIFGGTATLNMPGLNFSLESITTSETTVLVGYAGCAMTILGLYQKCRALTTAGTFNIKINGTNITGLTSIVPSTAGSYTAATAANTIARGDQITIVADGTLTLVLDLGLTLDYTMQL